MTVRAHKALERPPSEFRPLMFLFFDLYFMEAIHVQKRCLQPARREVGVAP